MRIVMVADRSFAAREHAMLDRLAVGLTDEGVRVVRAAPDEGAGAAATSFGQRLLYGSAAPTLAAPLYAMDIARGLEALGQEGASAAGRTVDIVHAFGDQAWEIAWRIAQHTGASMVADVWSGHSLARAQRWRSGRRGRPDEGPPIIWLAPDEAMQAAIKSAMPSAPTRLTPWGVHIPEDGERLKDPDRLSAIIVGAGRDGAANQSALLALSALAEDRPGLRIFLDAAILRAKASLWRTADHAGLLERLTIVAYLESERGPALQGDILIQPEALGEHRTISLDALASGMLVVARKDPVLSHLIDGQTSLLAPTDSLADWRSTLRSALEDFDRSRQIAAAGRAFVREHRLASAHVRSLLNAYEWAIEMERRGTGVAGRLPA